MWVLEKNSKVVPWTDTQRRKKELLEIIALPWGDGGQPISGRMDWSSVRMQSL